MIYNNKVYLAPMAGVADEVFRTIVSDYGSPVPFTEMISAKAMHYNDKKTLALLPGEDEGKMVVQIFGHEPGILAEAAEKMAPYATEININMGCPMPKIEGNGDGCALMKNPALAGEIVTAVKKAVSLPVSVKFRMGIESETSPEFAKAMEGAGADKIYIHGRTKEQLYSGKANLSAIRRVKESVQIPVVGNGDIFSALDAENMLKETLVDEIMVGRGCLGNPFLFREIEHYFKTGELLSVATAEERIDVCKRHLLLAVEKKGETRGILESRKHLAWYLKTIRGAAKIRAALFTSTDISEVLEMIESLK
ncbi:MAG: tRNA dihydrouridine synthase DusB [Clostridia bacterium]|nr:tRNA dihydrouridine synthase DusB [Clostridia bacterium]